MIPSVLLLLVNNLNKVLVYVYVTVILKFKIFYFSLTRELQWRG